MRSVHILKQDIIDWAKNFGCPILNSLSDFYYLEGCLPGKEQDEVAIKGVKFAGTEHQWDCLCAAYFDEWDVDYISGFCTSMRDRVVVGKYMAEYGIGEASLYDTQEEVDIENDIIKQIQKDPKNGRKEIKTDV